MKRFLFLLLFSFLCAAHASAQLQIPSFLNDPATCDPTRGLLYFNTTVSALKYCSGTNIWSLVPGTPSLSSASTHLIYATDPTYAGGAKFNGHLFKAALTNTVATLSTLTEMDGTTTYNPATSGVKNSARRARTTRQRLRLRSTPR